jgi:hypothetical protein
MTDDTSSGRVVMSGRTPHYLVSLFLLLQSFIIISYHRINIITIMTDTKEGTTPAPEAETATEHRVAIIGRGESVLVEKAPTDGDLESPKDFAAEIDAIKESEVSFCARVGETIFLIDNVLIH